MCTGDEKMNTDTETDQALKTKNGTEKGCWVKGTSGNANNRQDIVHTDHYVVTVLVNKS